MNKYHFFLLTLLCFNVHRLTPAETEEPATQKEINEAYLEILKYENNQLPYLSALLRPFNDFSPEIKKSVYAKIIQNKKTQIIKLLVAYNHRPALDMLSQEDIDNFNLIDAQQSKDMRLLNAIFEQDLGGVEEALKNRANPNAQIFTGSREKFSDVLETPIIRTLKPLYIQAMRRNLKNHEPEAQELIDQQTKTKNTIYNILKTLLDHGADPNIANIRKRPALFFACNFTSDTNICRLLLEHGANPNAEDDNGDKILHHLLIPLTIDEESIKLLLYYGASIPEGLHSGQLNLIKELQKEIETERIERETNDRSLATFFQTLKNNSQIPKTRNPVHDLLKKML